MLPIKAFPMRTIIYAHLALTTICVATSRGMLASFALSVPTYRWLLDAVYLPCLLSQLICPIAILIAVVCCKASFGHATGAVLAEFLIWCAMWWAILPAVQ
jgi:hypothetical protein